MAAGTCPRSSLGTLVTRRASGWATAEVLVTSLSLTRTTSPLTGLRNMHGLMIRSSGALDLYYSTHTPRAMGFHDVDIKISVVRTDIILLHDSHV